MRYSTLDTHIFVFDDYVSWPNFLPLYVVMLSGITLHYYTHKHIPLDIIFDIELGYRADIT